MSFKSLCIYEGLGIWQAAYPPLDDQEMTQLTSGMLSAIALFAKHTEGQNIKNMIIGDNDWTFAEIGDNDRGFLVLQIPVINKNIPGQFESELSTVITMTLRDEFTRRYPLALFQRRFEEGTMFSDFEPIAEEILRTYHAYHERRQSLDLKWLLDIKDCEKLITAAMDKQSIYFLTERSFDPNIHEIANRILAIIEFFYNTIKVNVNFIDDLQDIKASTNDPQAKSTVVNLVTSSVIQGPQPSIFAKKLVDYITSASDEKIKDIIENFEGFRREVVNNFDFTHLDEYSSKGTNFECGLCNQTVRFDIGNEASFITKTTHDRFFGMELSTYRVAHFAGQEIHVNEVLADQNGVVTKIVNSYTLNMQEYMSLSQEHQESQQQDFHVVTGQEELLKKDSKIKLFLLFNKVNHWIYEISCPNNFKCEEIAKLVQAKLREQELVMKVPSPYFSFDLGNDTVHVWVSSDLILCGIIEDKKIFNIFNNFAKIFLDHSYYGEEIFERRERLGIALKCLESKEFSPREIGALVRIVFDDTIISPIRLKYANVTPQLTTRLESEFPIAKSVLRPFLAGKMTILDAIMTENVPKVDELFELLDFINRRELIS
ncbi:MAG TPA: hypothetical protein VKM55_00755 [Candidatus Lokiarchaeia archaeon]|nr:hypothetical protein [Candidatus Lokiarchaeia archaeon]